jgi:NDP-sugar pyrophosphorylase family protein
VSAAVQWALVLAAGLGTRLRPLTECRAKATLPVAGTPLIRRVLAWLARAGITEVIINLHYRPETLTSLVGDGRDLGLRVRYSWEAQLLGTAGGVRHALPLIDAPRFFVVNADTLTDPPLDRLVEVHLASRALATLAVVPHPDPGRYGGLRADEAGRLLEFCPPGAPQSGWHFIGVQLVERAAFAELPDAQPIDTIPDHYGGLLRTAPGTVRVCPVTARFFEIGTPRDYLETCLALAQEERRDGTPVGNRVRIDPSARLERTVVWNDVQVEAGCELVDCIVGDGVHLPPGSRFRRRILLAEGRCAPLAATRVAAGVIAAPLD